MKWWDQMPWSLFSECWAISQLFHSLLSLSSFSAIRVVSSAYLRLLIFLPAILIPSCASSSLEFYMMYSAKNLNRVKIHSLDILICNLESVHCSMSHSNWCFLTCIQISSFQFSSIAQSCPTPCNPMNAARQPFPSSPTPGVHPNSCASSWWFLRGQVRWSGIPIS